MPGILRFISVLFLIFEKRISRETVPGVLKFAGILFLIFKKGDRQKNFVRYFDICKYAFLNI